MVKHLLLMSQVPSIPAEVTCFNFLDAWIPEVGFLGFDGYKRNVGLIAGFLVVNLDEQCPEGSDSFLNIAT